jgi:hypothetical protein
MLSYLDLIQDDINTMFKNKDKYYQNEVPYKTRCIDSNNILKKYPNYVPVIINTTEDIHLKKRKFLVPGDIYSYALIHYIKKFTNHPDKAIFLFYNNIILDNLQTISEKYDHYKLKNNNGDDKYFYLELYFENTFG